MSTWSCVFAGSSARRLVGWFHKARVRPPLAGLSDGRKKGSSRIAGKVILDLHEKELAVPVAVSHPLD
ncbi:hypothetical protein, partial [Pseudomonas sp. NPDC008258]|uniref:hypothetical protein n=1 Tax=Pseudomonas sp. NPDC008258 TaxID=3364418 RepID=UPI0036E10532